MSRCWGDNYFEQGFQTVGLVESHIGTNPYRFIRFLYQCDSVVNQDSETIKWESGVLFTAPWNGDFYIRLLHKTPALMIRTSTSTTTKMSDLNWIKIWVQKDSKVYVGYVGGGTNTTADRHPNGSGTKHCQSLKIYGYKL
jgi:hypothetical protein